MKNILIVLAVAWFLYLPQYEYTNSWHHHTTEGYLKIAIHKPVANTLLEGCWALKTIEGNEIVACGNYYVREE